MNPLALSGAVVGGLAVVGAGASYIGAKTLFNRVIPRQDELRVDISEMADGEKWEKYIEIIHAEREKLQQRQNEHVTIKSADGLTLHADLFPAEKPAKRTAILFHGYTSCGMNDCAAMGEYFCEQGYNVIIVDQRSHGKSEGKMIGFGILDRFDCIRWINYATERFGGDSEIVLFGISMGGATVLMASGTEGFPKNVKAIVSDCAFTSPYEVFKHILKRDYHLPEHPIMDISNKLCKKKAGYEFDEFSTLEALKSAKCPILFIHGADDNFVPAYMLDQNYNACSCEKSRLSIENAGHAAAQFEDRERYLSAVTEFLHRHLGE